MIPANATQVAQTPPWWSFVMRGSSQIGSGNGFRLGKIRGKRRPLDELAKLTEKGKPVPLTDQVRADRAKALELVAEITVASPQGIAAREALEALFDQCSPRSR